MKATFNANKSSQSHIEQSNNHVFQPWTEDDIDQLRLDFLRGLSIKRIARNMDRSPTAINKALSRFHIRTPRTFRTTTALAAPKRKHFFDNKPSDVGIIPWTPLETVIQWLKHQGHNVFCDNKTYYIERRPHSPLQLIMLANKLRTEQGSEIFLVEKITW